MQFRLWHLLILVLLAAVGSWRFTLIGTKVARYEILEMKVIHDQQWDKYWSRIKWGVNRPSHQTGQTFSSFIEVDKDFDAAGYAVGNILSFRYQETKFINRPTQNPKKMIVDKLFSVEGNVLEDNGGDIFAGPYPTVRKADSQADWE